MKNKSNSSNSSSSRNAWQHYRKKNIIKSFTKIYDDLYYTLRKFDLNAATLEQLEEADRQYVDFISKARKVISLHKINADVRDKAHRSKPEMIIRLDELRDMYIAKVNSVHDFHLSSKKLSSMGEKAKLKFNIGDYVFSEVATHIIPKEPKDEFPNARTLRRHFIIHYGDTNTGKTYNALLALKSANRGVYLAPLRLLALQVFELLNGDGVPCTLTTGEEDILIEGAGHISSTIEKLDVHETYDVAVIDEAQMLSDKHRGHAWVKAILGAASNEIHICCSPNAVKLAITLIESCGDTHEMIEYHRDTELIFEPEPFNFPTGVAEGDALIAFSKKMVLGISSLLTERGLKASVIYGDLPPETRRNQMKMFVDGESQIVVSTDAIGMGLNLPVKRIVFMESEKFNGDDVQQLTPSEVKQISGRAGRKGIYNVGYVNSVSDREYIRDSLLHRLGDLSSAYYLPLEKYVLSFPTGSLAMRLTACMDARKDIKYLSKTDISQALHLLKKIDNLDLSLEEKLSLIFIPFDVKSDALVEEWLNYTFAYIKTKTGDGSIPFHLGEIEPPPAPSSDNLDELERQYKSLGLLYSFCNTMKLPLNKQSIMDQKYDIAERIHKVLKTNMTMMGRKCRECGAKLSWDFPYPVCESCFSKMRRHHR